MKKQTQKDWVLNQLIKKSKISRNACLKRYISRLGAIICSIKNESFLEITGEYKNTKNGRDYIYYLK
jgi:hypothetical protein